MTCIVCELLGSIFKFLFEKVKFGVFFNVILTDLEEKFSILSWDYFLVLTAWSEKSKKVELNPNLGIIEVPFK